MLCHLHPEQKTVVKNGAVIKTPFTISWERNKWEYYFEGNYLSFLLHHIFSKPKQSISQIFLRIKYNFPSEHFYSSGKKGKFNFSVSWGVIRQTHFTFQQTLLSYWWNLQGDISPYASTNLERRKLNYCEHTSKNRPHYPQWQYICITAFSFWPKLWFLSNRDCSFLEGRWWQCLFHLFSPNTWRNPWHRENHIIQWINSWI